MPARYRGDQERLLMHFVETIQALPSGDPSSDNRDTTTLLTAARSWLAFLVDETQLETEDIRQFHAATFLSCGRRFGITRRGHLCLVPRHSRAGDAIFIPRRSRVPFIFRVVDASKDVVQNVGECYVHSAMSGEGISPERR
ncbi:hypothetical protein QBC47DRAFT_187335 [Echria macrotheca]|uniref:Uncharacterized protein n=1 Tax=Echria macrotheca TaxID=438768 RepID=A0AAJ0BDZ9_9PEZI|nr:hypothetical protein QBC47DRAFT_187335 [Echria macrotheca]